MMAGKVVNKLFTMTILCMFIQISHASWLCALLVTTFRSHWGLFQALVRDILSLLSQYI